MTVIPELDRLLREWRRRRLVVSLWYAGAAATLAHGTLLLAWGPTGVATALVAGASVFAAGAILGWIRALPRTDDAARLALHLDRVVPDLQESAELLVHDARSPLGELQRRRSIEALRRHAGQRHAGQRHAGRRHAGADLWPRAARRRAMAAMALALLAAVGLGGWGIVRERRAAAVAAAVSPPARGSRTAAPRPEALAVFVAPPAYLRRPERRGTALDLEAEEGSRVRWEVSATAAASGVLAFDDGELALERRADGTLTAERTVLDSHVYALVLRAAPAAGEMPEFRSPFARLAVQPDRPPTVRIDRPEALLVVEPDRLGRLAVAVAAADDFGLDTVDLIATVARGAGEQVEFRAERLSLSALPGGAADSRAPGLAPNPEKAVEPGGTELGARRFGRTLDLAAFGLVAGSELYLQAEARDRKAPRPNLAQSEAVRVRVAGGAAPSAAFDRGLPAIHMEVSLRSQRQLIADTERLLAEKPKLSAADFERRSVEIGFDQRALRLRYGALLGEEFESGSPAGESPEEEHGGEPGAPSDQSADAAAVQALLGEFVHQHDSQEIATFFDDPQRARMKAALAEMWGAEGKLRLGDPRAALPFEYRALRLLKTAQEQSRVYVAKLGSELPRLDLGKRLTGELDGISTRAVRLTAEARPETPVAAALAVVAALRSGKQPSGADPTARRDAPGSDANAGQLDSADPLAAVAAPLARAAAGGDTAALAGLDALAAVRAALARREPLDALALARLERGLAALLPVPPATPAPRDPPGSLGVAYQRAVQGGRP